MNKIYICLFSFLFFYSNLLGQTSNEMENAWEDIDYKDNAWVRTARNLIILQKDFKTDILQCGQVTEDFMMQENKHGDGNVLVCLEPLKTYLLKL